MTDRDRLIELIKNSNSVLPPCFTHIDFDCRGIMCKDCYGKFADYILADGWIKPPCKVGDTVWYITGTYGTVIKSAVIDAITIERNGVNELCVTNENGVSFWNSVDIFYPTKEEAEKALNERKEK